MASENNGAFIRNIAEVPWREFPNHFGGALSKPLVMPETAGSRHIDYRISMYQPMAHVARHIGFHADFPFETFARASRLAIREVRPSNLFGYWKLLRCINEKPASGA